MQLGNMSKIVSGRRYSTKTATVIASDEYWDGDNSDNNGRNTYLLRLQAIALIFPYRDHGHKIMAIWSPQ